MGATVGGGVLTNLFIYLPTFTAYIYTYFFDTSPARDSLLKLLVLTSPDYCGSLALWHVSVWLPESSACASSLTWDGQVGADGNGVKMV